MKRIICLMLIIVLSFGMVTGSFADSGKIKERNDINDDYNLEVKLIKGIISEDEYEKNVKENYKNKIKKDTTKLSTKLNLSDYYIYETGKKIIDNVEFEEIHFKRKQLKNENNRILNTYRSSGPEDGDFKIVISPESLSGRDWFDMVEGYGSYLLNQSAFNLVKLGSSFNSNSIRGLLSTKFIEYIENDMKGKGTSYSMDRNVYKWGKIYDNGRWETYYYGKQYEVKWGFKFMVYDDNNNLIDDKEYKYYYPKNDPIFIKASRYFRDNNAIFTKCNGQYNSNGATIFDRRLVVTKKASNWKIGINPCYK